MKKTVFFFLCFVTTIIHTSQELPQIVVALPLYGAFVKKPNSTDTGAQILGDIASFIPVMGSPWNVLKLRVHQSKIAAIGKEVEKTKAGSYNILYEVARQANDKKYGTMSKAMQDKLACSIVRQPVIAGIQALISALRAQGISILGYANQDEKEYQCFKRYCAEKDIDLPAVCNAGVVVYRHHESVSEFSDDQLFLQKDGVTVAQRPFPHRDFLSALYHHSQGSHLLTVAPPHLKRPSSESIRSQSEMVAFTSIDNLRRVLEERNILQNDVLTDIL